MNKTVKWIIITVLVMVVLPWVIFSIAKAEAMGLMFVLFFGVCPLYSIIIGWQAGKEKKKNWFLAIFSAGLFFLGEGLIINEWLYTFALVYLVIGVLFMVFTGISRGNK